ncbi:concanavalin A-like lectin/glucanase domain-containing protein [Aspergillus multicolor]|uniref:glycoside hydrolase family 16 protein n=1 Tax=Aspergillus multicolor TaxID=41759 RepID=UPI003CCDC773
MHFKYAAALASVLPVAIAQTFTDCNPLEETCDPNPGLNSKTFSSDFTQGESALNGWIKAAGDVSFGPDGAEFTVGKKGDAPTIDTDFYFFFGKAEVVMKAAPGVGIVSSIVLESDVLDEVDWETLGGDTTQVQTNYFGKGDTTTYDRGTFEAIATPQEIFHTYTVTWSPDAISWIIDGTTVRTLNYADAQGGSRFPQTPARLRLGIWTGGDSDNAPGTIEWAGGETDYNAGPFTMYVKSVSIENTYPGSEYTYTDNSGDWQSIDIDNSKPPAQTTTKTTSTTSTTVATSSTDKPQTETGGTSSTTKTTTTTTDSENSTKTDTPTSTSTETITTTSESETASPTATETGSGSGSGSGSDSSSGSSTPSNSGSATPTSGGTTEDPQFTGAASPLTRSAGGLFTVLGMMAAMLQL